MKAHSMLWLKELPLLRLSPLRKSLVLCPGTCAHQRTQLSLPLLVRPTGSDSYLYTVRKVQLLQWVGQKRPFDHFLNSLSLSHLYWEEVGGTINSDTCLFRSCNLLTCVIKGYSRSTVGEVPLKKRSWIRAQESHC